MGDSDQYYKKASVCFLSLSHSTLPLTPYYRGSENPRAYVEHQHDSPEVNVLCAISSQKVYGPIFFAEETVNDMTYPDMLQTYRRSYSSKTKSRILPLLGSLVPEHSVARTLDRACVWKRPTTDIMAPKVQ